MPDCVVRQPAQAHPRPRDDPGPLPGDDPVDFLESWLRLGTGGTCWAGNGARHAVLVALEFPARRGVAAMLAVPVPDLPPNHGTVAVDLDGERWLVEASMISVEPLRLIDGQAIEVEHPARGVRAEHRDGRHHVRWNHGFREPFECRIEGFGAEAGEFATRHEQTRAWSPFNCQVMVRQNHSDEVVGVGLGRRLRIGADGTQDHAEAIVAALPPDEELPSPPRRRRGAMSVSRVRRGPAASGGTATGPASPRR